jgi:O6-methylguanine-DNA--protein-cysteine methyltransferase
VLGANGIGGFMRGRGADALSIKRWLLRHEGVRAV